MAMWKADSQVQVIIRDTLWLKTIRSDWNWKNLEDTNISSAEFLPVGEACQSYVIKRF